jgi:Glycosyltransferase family 87
MSDQPLEAGTTGAAADRPEPHLFDFPAAVTNLIEQVQRNRRLVMAGASAFVFLLLVLAISRALYGSNAFAYDFHAYYDAVQRLIATGSPYQPERTLSGPFKAGPYGLYLYSPVPAVVLLALANLPVSTAAIVYLAARLVMLVAMCAIMPISRAARLAVLGVACLSAPVIQDLNLGNASLVVTFFAVVAWRFLDRPAGAASIAASISIRPTMALFVLWWLVRGRLRMVAATIGAALVLFALTLPFVGIGGWLDYVRVIGNLTEFERIYRNFALGALVGHAGAPSWLAELALYAGYAVGVGAVVLSLRRDRELSFVVTLGATLLLSPLLWDHYLTNILVPAAFMAGRGRWWALILPLLCWLPQELLAFIAIAGTLVPFAAPDRGEPVRTVLDRLPMWRRRQPAPA